MPLHLIVKKLNEARREKQSELEGIDQALKALGSGQKKPSQATRVLSAEARKRISLAQKKRWRLARKAA